MCIVNPKAWPGMSDVEFAAKCEHPDVVLRGDVSHYFDDDGNLVIETLIGDKEWHRVVSYCEDLKRRGLIDERGMTTSENFWNRKKIAKIRSILNNKDLCAEAMVSEIGEIVG